MFGYKQSYLEKFNAKYLETKELVESSRLLAAKKSYEDLTQMVSGLSSKLSRSDLDKINTQMRENKKNFDKM